MQWYSVTKRDLDNCKQILQILGWPLKKPRKSTIAMLKKEGKRNPIKSSKPQRGEKVRMSKTPNRK